MQLLETFRFNEPLILKKFVADALLPLLLHIWERRDGAAVTGKLSTFPVDVTDRLLKFSLRCPLSEMDCSNLV